MEKYKDYRIIDGKPRWVIVEQVGRIIDRCPTKEVLKGLETYVLPRHNHDIGKELLLEYLNRFYEETGNVPIARYFKNDPKYPTYDRYLKNFGSWDNAIEFAKLDKLKGKKKRKLEYTDDELLDILRQFYNETGRIPVGNEFGIPGTATYRRRFRSWSNALKLVGLDNDTMVDKGILDNCDRKARKAEIIVKDHFKNSSIDLSGDNKNSPFDGICPNGKLYDVKSSSLLEHKGWLYWLFNIKNKHRKNIEIYYFLAFNIDYTKLEYAWRIPEEMTENDKDFYVGVSRAKSDMKEYDITDKLLNSIGVINYV